MARIIRLIGMLTRTAVRLVIVFLKLATESDNRSGRNGPLEGAFRGGVLNYRTGILDDGTDPYGWYEED